MPKDTLPSITLGKRVAKTPGNPLGYETCRGPDTLNRPCVVVFGGTSINKNEQANGAIKRIQYILGRHGMEDGPIPVYAATYPYHEQYNTDAIGLYNGIRKEKYTERFYAAAPEARNYKPADDVERFVREYILPLAAEHFTVDKNDEVHGTPRSFEQAKRSLRNLNIVAHSFGTQVIEEIGDALANDLHSLGFSEQQIHELTAQLFVLSIGDVTPIKAHHNAHFTTMHILNHNDLVVEFHARENIALAYKELMQRQDLIGRDYDDPAIIKPVDTVPPPKNPAPDIKAPSLVVGPVKSKDSNADNRWLACCREILPMRRVLIDEKDGLAADHKQHIFPNYVMLGVPELYRDPGEKADFNSNQLYNRYKDMPLSNAFMVPTLVASVLRNALDNSVRNANASESKSFSTLPPMPELMQCRPARDLAYDMSTAPEAGGYARLHEFSKGIGYQTRLDAAIMPGGVKVEPKPVAIKR